MIKGHDIPFSCFKHCRWFFNIQKKNYFQVLIYCRKNACGGLSTRVMNDFKITKEK